ncbi:MAG: chromosome partitioning protein ParB [Actinomycetota bacterium]
MAENRRLGRGLSTLIPTQKPKADAAPEKSEPAPAKREAEPKKQASAGTELPNSALRDVPVGSIAKNPNQPRVHFDESALADLAKSIKEIGVLQPLLVRELSAGRYELIAGERRWRAAQIAKLRTVPVVVREVNELASVEQALVENLHREDLTALEEASAYQQLAEDFGLTHEQVAKRVGKSRAAVTNALRLLNLPATVQGYLADGRLQAGHARALLGCHDTALMESLAASAVREEWSVRAVEDAVKSGGRASIGGGGGGVKPIQLKPAGLLELEKMLADFLDTRVNVSMAGKRGKISIDFADLMDLERIYRRMTEQQD